ncbi:MAG: PorP/SprF family type IX secretion system membrane protein [Saprospiraceae bacterium]|nr:PorP/SprF family type IX secretion system membrane protein [Lewinella sp.]
MKIQKPLHIIFGALLFCSTLAAQDIHNSLFNMAPLSLNPALTGAFEGTARIGGIYRAQDFGITDARGYYSPSFYVDAPIIQGFRKQDWIGAGFMVYSDNAGSLRLKTNISGLSGSYHFAIDKQQKNVLTLGVQWGSTSRKYEYGSGVFSDTFDESLGGLGNPSTTDPLGIQTGGGTKPGDNEENQTSYSDINAGLMFRSTVNEKTRFEIGVAAGHITTPNYSFEGGSSSGNPNPTPTPAGPKDRPMKIVAHGRLLTQVTDLLSFEPTFLFQTTAGQSEIGIQAWGGYRINPDAKANFGLGYRVGDAAKVLLGMEYKDLRAALSYDITLSDRHRINDYNGAFEIAAYYIIKVYKKPNVKPAIFCPQF